MGDDLLDADAHDNAGHSVADQREDDGTHWCFTCGVWVPAQA